MTLERYSKAIKNAYKDGWRDAMDGITSIIRVECVVPKDVVLEIGRISLKDNKVMYADVDRGVFKEDPNMIAAIEFLHGIILKEGEDKLVT